MLKFLLLFPLMLSTKNYELVHEISSTINVETNSRCENKSGSLSYDHDIAST